MREKPTNATTVLFLAAALLFFSEQNEKQQKFAPRREESFHSNVNVKFLLTGVIDFSSNITNSFNLSKQISKPNFILRQSQIGSNAE
jgi:hypothetical protein